MLYADKIEMSAPRIAKSILLHSMCGVTLITRMRSESLAKMMSKPHLPTLLYRAAEAVAAAHAFAENACTHRHARYKRMLDAYHDDVFDLRCAEALQWGLKAFVIDGLRISTAAGLPYIACRHAGHKTSTRCFRRRARASPATALSRIRADDILAAVASPRWQRYHACEKCLYNMRRGSFR